MRRKSERGWTGQKGSTPADPTLYTTVLISTYDFLLILHRTAIKSVVQIGHRYEFLKLTSRALRPVQTVMMFERMRGEDESEPARHSAKFWCPFFVTLPSAISVWARGFAKTADRKTITNHHPLVQTAKTNINYYVEFEHELQERTSWLKL